MDVIVSVADDHLDDIAGVVADLRRAGMRVDEVMDAVGTVTGTVEPDGVGALESVRGVAAVERAHRYQLPPPDSEVQ